jgi:1-acyl-sn-glycerol-3-phosphate acyltransferase
MIWLRSIVYLVCFAVWAAAVPVCALPALVSRSSSLAATRLWSRGVLFLARVIVGIKFEVRGREHLPDGPYIVAAQHQAAFETFALFLLFDRPVFILKESLQWIPLIGWYIKRDGLVGINRSAGAGAMRRMLRAAEQALARGETLLLFPEGTRTAPGVHNPYKPGIVALYNHTGVPVVPMALNTGYYWGKTRLLKIPGQIVFQFLPPIGQGLSKDEFLTTLRSQIEEASAALPVPAANLQAKTVDNSVSESSRTG